MFAARRVVLLVFVMVAVGGLIACAKVPQPAIDQARETLAAASEAEASVYAAAEWEAAQQAMNSAMAEVEAQNAKFVLLRSYGKAGELLAAAQSQAEAARQAGVDGKEAMRAKVSSGIAGIAAKLAQSEQMLDELASCGKRPKGFASDLELFRGNVSALAAQLAEVQAAADTEDFSQADSMVQGLTTEVDAVVADLENAKAALGC